MSYKIEFRSHWSNLLGASLGIAMGSALSHYTTNLFAPALIAEFGWSRSQFALIGTLALVSMISVPFAGRFTDRFGTRVAGTVGYVAITLSYVLYSMMRGSIAEFFAITVFQYIFGVLTATLVFCRVVVERFDKARGFALSLVMTGAPLAGAVLTPLIAAIIDAEGWRMGYRVMAVLSGLGGLVAILLATRTDKGTSTPKQQPVRLTATDFKIILRNPALLLVIAGMFFCNFPQVIVNSQLNLLLMDNGAHSRLAAWIVSIYAGGVIAGRFVCGLALDRVSPQIVALLALGLPAAGFFAIASPFDMGWVLAGAVLLMGLAQGAEGDIGAYIISRQFSLAHYSFVYSLLIASMGAAMAIGSVTLSFTLRATGGFDTFLVIAAALTLIGALCFFATGRGRKPEGEPDQAALAADGIA
jgi:MFS family permease